MNGPRRTPRHNPNADALTVFGLLLIAVLIVAGAWAAAELAHLAEHTAAPEHNPVGWVRALVKGAWHWPTVATWWAAGEAAVALALALVIAVPVMRWGTAGELDRFHRHHATVELAIRDIKQGSGMAHCPSGSFAANGAWLACAVLAHNLCRWTALLGDVHPDDQLTVVVTLRSQLICMPGRLVNRAGTPTLRGPLHWPWQRRFDRALANIRALPAVAPG